MTRRFSFTPMPTSMLFKGTHSKPFTAYISVTAEDQGTSSNPAQDTIVDFNVTANSDNINLRAILNNVTDGISADNYIDLTENDGSVTLHIKDNGEDITQVITLNTVSKDALYGAGASSATETEILQKMIDDNNLLAG